MTLALVIDDNIEDIKIFQINRVGNGIFSYRQDWRPIDRVIVDVTSF